VLYLIRLDWNCAISGSSSGSPHSTLPASGVLAKSCSPKAVAVPAPDLARPMLGQEKTGGKVRDMVLRAADPLDRMCIGIWDRSANCNAAGQGARNSED
jgi:hypothetical protein